jgi:hypothetical protein
MNDRLRPITTPLALWSRRLALFAASLIVVGVLLHRLTSFPTPVALNLFGVGIGVSVLGVFAAVIALAQIWRRGYAGASSAAIGVLLPLALAAWPLAYLPAMLKLPRIYDVTTDLSAPPPFAALAKNRTDGANGADYPGRRFADAQQQAYPDLRTLVIERSVEESYELVEETVAKLKWRVAATTPPTGRPAKAGFLEATDRTLLVGFTDDISVRVEGNATRARIDVRSASRYGQFDFGQNAARVRRFLAEVRARADATLPSGISGRRALRTTRAGAMVKRRKEHDRPKVESRTSRDHAQPSAQRARAQRE